MDTLIHADIFFIITSVSTVILVVLAIIAMIFIISILANVRYISKKLKVESDFLAEEMREFRRKIEISHTRIFPLFRLLQRIVSRYYQSK